MKIGLIALLIVAFNLSKQSTCIEAYEIAENFVDSSQRVYVPDSQTAVGIAKAVFMTFYGEKYIKKGRPASATLDDSGIWTVKWHTKVPFYLRRNLFRGEPVIYINKKDGKIFNVFHTK